MRVRDVLRECKAAGVSDIDVWLYSWGGLTWFGRWYVGTRTLYRYYQREITWGTWWAEFRAVNGYRHHTDIAHWSEHVA